MAGRPELSRGRTGLWAARRLLGAAPALATMTLAAAHDRLPSWRATPAPPEERARRRRRAAEALRRLALDTGGLLIKVGQAIASRADLFPPEYVEILATLEDRVPPRPFAIIRAQIERELGRPVGEIFARLDEEALAAASLAQVHRGRLPDGREVAVKVLYPGIEDAVTRDLALLRWLLAPLVRRDRGLELDSVVDELAATIPAELDLLQEGRNAERIGALLAPRGDVVVPAIVWPVSTRRVLVMEYIDGIKITDVGRLRAAGIDVQDVAQRLVDVFCEQILEHGVLHADPHPGNLLVLPGARLALLDFGLVKVLPPGFRPALGELVQSVALDDHEGTRENLRALGFRTAGDDPAPLLALCDLFLRSFAAGRGYASRELVAQADRRLREAAAATPVLAIPGDLTLVARVMATLSGIGKQLESRVNIPLTMLAHS